MMVDKFRRGKRSQTRVRSKKAGGRQALRLCLLMNARTILRHNNNEVSKSLAPTLS